MVLRNLARLGVVARRAGQRLDEAGQRRERRAQLVAGVGDEVRAHAFDHQLLGQLAQSDQSRARAQPDRHDLDPERARRRSRQVQVELGRAVPLQRLVDRGEDAGIAQAGLEQLADRIVTEQPRRGGIALATTRPSSTTRSGSGKASSRVRNQRSVSARRSRSSDNARSRRCSTVASSSPPSGPSSGNGGGSRPSASAARYPRVSWSRRSRRHASTLLRTRPSTHASSAARIVRWLNTARTRSVIVTGSASQTVRTSSRRVGTGSRPGGAQVVSS